MTFEQFSKEIDEIVQMRQISWRGWCYCYLQYWLRRYCLNLPLPFPRVGEKGEKVGEPIEIVHVAFYDIAGHQVRGILTEKLLLEGLRMNAFQEIDFERLDDWNGKTTVQPRWV